MPGSMDGIGMAQQILKRRRDLPVVLASGYIVSPDRLNDPEVAFLAKPYSAEKLWEVLTGCACRGGA
jgi:CheY-like chemotaxis protein